MSAIVGILNKQAIAIAGDSAVTVGGKIMNKANKLFTLSKFHPVGIMVHNIASFMGTPWETIIKVYRSKLGNKSFDTVIEYQEDFIEFIKANNFFTSELEQKQNLYHFLWFVIESVVNEVADKNPNLIKGTPENKIEYLQLLEQKIDSYIDTFSHSANIYAELQDLSLESFEQYIEDFYPTLIKQMFIDNDLNISPEAQTKIKNLSYFYIKAEETYTSYSGLVFVGFGEKEIYPQLHAINVSMVFNNRLRYMVDKSGSASISNNNVAAICPFAQTHVINTILTGVDPSLDTIYNTNFEASFKKYNSEILGILGENSPELSAQISALDIGAISAEYAEQNNETKRLHHVDPLIKAVGTLAKEDLAEMAESLIFLTYLKKRITFEAESVGGPVDVAIISKGDGFIWIKRKHYFKPELNQHFFDNYSNR